MFLNPAQVQTTAQYSMRSPPSLRRLSLYTPLTSLFTLLILTHSLTHTHTHTHSHTHAHTLNWSRPPPPKTKQQLSLKRLKSSRSAFAPAGVKFTARPALQPRATRALVVRPRFQQRTTQKPRVFSSVLSISVPGDRGRGVRTRPLFVHCLNLIF